MEFSDVLVCLASHPPKKSQILYVYILGLCDTPWTHVSQGMWYRWDMLYYFTCCFWWNHRLRGKVHSIVDMVELVKIYCDPCRNRSLFSKWNNRRIVCFRRTGFLGFQGLGFRVSRASKDNWCLAVFKFEPMNDSTIIQQLYHKTKGGVKAYKMIAKKTQLLVVSLPSIGSLFIFFLLGWTLELLPG